MSKTQLCPERRRLCTGGNSLASFSPRLPVSPHSHILPFSPESRLRQASVAVKFVTNTTKECRRALAQRLQRLDFDLQVELATQSCPTAQVCPCDGTWTRRCPSMSSADV